MNRKRFDELLSRLLDESLTPLEGNELAALVADDLSLRRELHSQLALDEALSQLADPPRSAGQFSTAADARLVAESGRFEFMHRILDAVDESSSKVDGNRPTATTGSNATRYRRAGLAFMALACAALAGVWLVVLSNATEDRSVDLPVVSVGSFTRSANVQWSAGAHRWSVGDALAEGRSIEFDSGRVELQFDSGALMTVVGPAALEIRSANLVALHAGTATTRIEDGNSGKFRVVTPATEVLDLGTEFGVRARPDGQTDVVVFEGKVDLTPIDSVVAGAFTTQRLSVGEAVCVNRAGDWKRLVSIESDAFPSGDEIFNLARSRPPVIVSVTDNLSTSERPKYYSIVPGGFRDDAKAYVDRVHEWNGLDRQGLPPELVGGDYVRMFNDDKRSSGLEVVVTLAAPAQLYVLFDDRVPTPGWLKSEFINTGIGVGFDAGHPQHYERGPGWQLGTGPGRSVDNRFSVWQRRVRAASEVVLGSSRERPEQKTNGTAMYGIVAVPLDDRDDP